MSETPDIEIMKYPVGKFIYPDNSTFGERIALIESLPAKLRQGVDKLTVEQLGSSYRPGGWSVRQVVHHVADSHMNALIRLKLALTEDNPTVKPYFEDRFAELADYKFTPVEISLNLVEAIHISWTILLKSLSPDDIKRTFFHPDRKRSISIEENTALYAWHGRHHLAQITSFRERMNW